MKKLMLLVVVILSCLTGCSVGYLPNANKPLIQSVPITPTDTLDTPIGGYSPNGMQKPVQDVNMNQVH